MIKWAQVCIYSTLGVPNKLPTWYIGTSFITFLQKATITQRRTFNPSFLSIQHSFFIHPSSLLLFLPSWTRLHAHTPKDKRLKIFKNTLKMLKNPDALRRHDPVTQCAYLSQCDAVNCEVSGIKTYHRIKALKVQCVIFKKHFHCNNDRNTFTIPARSILFNAIHSRTWHGAVKMNRKFKKNRKWDEVEKRKQESATWWR